MKDWNYRNHCLQFVDECYSAHQGKLHETAKALGITPVTLRKMLRNRKATYSISKGAEKRAITQEMLDSFLLAIDNEVPLIDAAMEIGISITRAEELVEKYFTRPERKAKNAMQHV